MKRTLKKTLGMRESMQGRNKHRKKDLVPKVWIQISLEKCGWPQLDDKKRKIWIALNQSWSTVAGQKYSPRVQADGYWCMKCWKSVVSGFCIGQTAVRWSLDCGQSWAQQGNVCSTGYPLVGKKKRERKPQQKQGEKALPSAVSLQCPLLT